MARKIRKDGRYQASIYLGRFNGKRKYKVIYAETQKELKAKEIEVRTMLGKGIDLTAQRDTFGFWATQWLKLKKLEVSPYRYRVYECRVKNLEILENAPITKLRAMDIQSVILEYSDFAPSTLKEIKSTARQILQLAVDNRVIDYNPAISVKIPTKGKKEKPETEERRALTEEEQRWIRETPHRAQTAAMIMMYAGLRRGEVAPLTWDDVDLEEGIIRINKSMQLVKNDWEMKKGAKTEASVRNVFIPDILTDYLLQLDKSNKLVCPNTKGKLMSLSSWRKMWDSYLTELNLKYGDFSEYGIISKSKFSPKGIPFVIPKITPHWLRHTFITSMYLAGVDVLTAKEQAGHADINTTLSIYTHLDSTFKKRQIDKLNDFFNNSKM